MVLIDTLRMQRRLRETGLSEKQATLVAEKFANILVEALASKINPSDVMAEVEGRLHELGQILNSSDAERSA